MRISEGTSFEQADHSWLKLDVELEDADFDRAMTEWNVHPSQVAQVPVTARYSIMSVLARLMLADRMISARAHDGTSWVKDAGQPMKDAVLAELGQLFKVVTGLPVKERS